MRPEVVADMAAMERAKRRALARMTPAQRWVLTGALSDSAARFRLSTAGRWWRDPTTPHMDAAILLMRRQFRGRRARPPA